MAAWFVEGLANIPDIGFARHLPFVSFRLNPGSCRIDPQALSRISEKWTPVFGQKSC